MTRLSPENRDLLMFMGTLVAIVLLSKIGGTGSDLAIMTGLIGVLGMIVGQKRATQAPSGKPGDPVAVSEEGK
jgi:hypothetical protein